MRARVMKLHRDERGKRTYRADGRTDGRTNALLGVSGRQEERASATLSSNGAAATAAGIHSVQYVVGGSLMWKWNSVYV